MNEDYEELTKKQLKEKNIQIYYEKILNTVRTDLPIKKPVLNDSKDYDESVLDQKYVKHHKEKKLRVENYMLKASSIPICFISIENFIKNE